MLPIPFETSNVSKLALAPAKFRANTAGVIKGRDEEDRRHTESRSSLAIQEIVEVAAKVAYTFRAFEDLRPSKAAGRGTLSFVKRSQLKRAGDRHFHKSWVIAANQWRNMTLTPVKIGASPIRIQLAGVF